LQKTCLKIIADSNQGPQDSGRTGAEKMLRAMQNYKKQKNITKYACFCSETILT